MLFEAFVLQAQIISPWAGSIQGELGADVEFLACLGVAHASADDGVVFPAIADRLDAIRNICASTCSGAHEGEHQARRVVHLAVFENHRAAEIRRIERREERQNIFTIQDSRWIDVTLTIANARVPSPGQRVVKSCTGTEEKRTASAAAVGGDGNRQWVYEVWCDS